MKKIYKISKKITVIFLMGIFLLPYGLFAQGGVKQGELVSCFDYYTFGDVKVDLNADFQTYKAGETVLITGTVKNTNTFPVVGLDIKARLVKDIPEADPMTSEILILDEFDVVDNATLAPGEEYTVSYPHGLPRNAPSGQYQIYFYAVEQDRFNLSGLSFTNNITASQLSFEVAGEQADHVYLDQTQIKVGGNEYNVMSPDIQIEADVEIPVTIPLYNPHETPVQMTVTYDLYSWDSINPNNKVDTKIEQVTVAPKSEYLLKYTVSKGDLPMYYLSITAEPTEQVEDVSVYREKTISNIRFEVLGKSKPYINFVGIDSYPLRGGEATFVTCFQNLGTEEDTSITKIETVLYDQNKRELSRTEYEGNLSPDILGLAGKFKPQKNITQFMLVSKMYNAKGDVIDTIEQKYECKNTASNSCSSEEDSSILIWIVTVIIIVGLGVLIYKRKDLLSLRV
jgi:hypothetical protein